MITREQVLVEKLKREKQKRAARNNFWEYRRYMNPSLKVGWFQKDVAKNLQQFYEDLINKKRPKLVIQAPPQFGKSTQIIDFIGWLSGKNPDLKTIYASFSDRLGIRANKSLQRTYDTEKYKGVFPNIKLNGIRNSALIEYSGFDGYFRNTTVAGSITGETLNLGVIDDPVKGREEANSLTIRDKTWDWFTDDFFTRFSEDAGLLAILTRWHVDDPIGRLIERVDGVKVLSYPAIATEDEYIDEVLVRKKGESLFPEHKSLEFLEERREAMPVAHWEALYQQHPIISDGNLFKSGKIEIIDAIPSGYIQWVRGWDLASTSNGDYTAGGKIGKLKDGRYIIADMRRERFGPDERDELILNTASLDGKNCVISIPQDPGQAGKTQVMYLTRKLAGYRVKSSPESGDKATRAGPFAAQVNVGNVVMLRGEWNSDLLEEMRMFPNGVNDDQVDSLSRAFGEIVQGKPQLRLA